MTKKKDKTVDEQTQLSIGVTDLSNALAGALQAIKPKEKVTAANRKAITPWTPKNDEPRVKLKRKMYHHGQLVSTRLFNDEIELLNKIKPGIYCNGWIKVIRRKDKGLDIDYKVKTASHRLKLVNEFGIRNFKELLERLAVEAENPVQYKIPDDE